RLIDLPAELPMARWEAVARFLLRFLLGTRFEDWNPVRLASRPQPRPEVFFAGMPGRESNDEEARRGLARVHLPARGGNLRPAGSLRFTTEWDPAYANLDLLDPEAAAPQAAPTQFAAYL